MKQGDKALITCYQKGCNGVQIKVELGKPYEVYGFFVRLGGVGRICWNPAKDKLEGFRLAKMYGGSGYCNCPNCRTLFGGVIVIESPGKEPVAFGYDPEPA